MIYKNNKTINEWYFNDAELIKVYKNGAICYYKMVLGETPHQEPCFAVVDNIQSYSDTEFVDVYDKATEKWYKLNNLDQYEEYGIYGSGRTVCEGSTSRLPQGYTEVEYVGSNGNAYINTGLQLMDTVGNTFSIEGRVWTEYYVTNDGFGYLMSTELTTSPYPGIIWRWNQHHNNVLEFGDNGASATLSTVDEGDGTSGFTVSSNGTSSTNYNIPFSLFAGLTGTSSSNSAWRFSKSKYYDELKITKNNQVVADYIPCQRDSDSKYGFYDLVSESFITSSNSYALIGGNPIAPADCVTVYEGKLTIDNGYEYEWDGSQWDNLGELSGSSVPDNYVIPFDDSTVKNICVTNWGGNVVAGEITYGEAKAVTSLGSVFQRQTIITSFNELAYFHGLTSLVNGEFVMCTSLRDIVIPSNVTSIGYNNTARATFSGCTNLSGLTILSGDETLTMDLFSNSNSYYMNSSHSNTPMCFPDRIMTFSGGTFGYCDYLTQAYFQNATPPVNLANSDIDNYRKLANVYCPVGSLSAYQTALSGKGKTITEYDFETDSLGLLDKEKEWIAKTQSVIVYPKYYTEKDEPENNVVFANMEEALAYECPWVGMRAIIGGDIYIFDSNNEWSKVSYYYKVEDVTTSAQGGSGWTVTGSSTYNPDLDYYDDYSVYQESSTSQYKVAKVTIFGYDNFTYYLRSSGYSSNNYVVATNLDELQTDPTGMTYSNTSAITNTYNFNKAPASVVNLSNYRRVTYNNLDKTVEHTFYVIFYGRYRNSVYGTATLLIPKDQTQENWEQVTFSSSTNVGVVQKNLYIDGNNSTSGGTNIFFYRWMIGLPSGSHTSYTNYSNYSYCPSVTSSTFTSVAGGVRQVDYVYNSTTTKNLQFRLVDGSGNTITTGDTVYYNMTMGNGCGASTSYSNATFPSTRAVTVGGSFVFTNSSNRHYIYGYAPNIQFNTSYYSDNYNTYFDIPYTKLDTEAVTVTYTTYDPNDTEIPAFSTKITYPYNGGTTSSITLTSYDVPYTYPYVVSQTNTMFSADFQSFTAGQSSRTVTFTLYPNNRVFSTVADMEAYQYAWEGMVAYVDDTRYKYENGEWVEKAYALPDVPFILNYNAKNYVDSTHSITKTDGQLRNSDAVCNYGYHIVDHSTDGYITVTGDTRMIISGTPYFNRTNTQTGCTMTIVSKVKTTNANNSYSILTNRNNNMNWMWRYPSNGIFLHGSVSYNNPKYLVSTTGQPITASIRISYDGSVKQQLNDWTNNGSYSGDFQYGSESTGNSAMFCDYTTTNSEFWKGDFYWVYMSFNVLTDEQIQQVIDYNENL